MRNGSQPPRSADRRLRVGPGRPAGCPRRTPGEARRRKFVFWFGGALVREFLRSGRVQTKAGFLFSPVGTPWPYTALGRLDSPFEFFFEGLWKDYFHFRGRADLLGIYIIIE